MGRNHVAYLQSSCFIHVLIHSLLLPQAPDLDLIAPQDSMGAQGNSFANVSAFLGNASGASRRQGRTPWTNVELFEVWPPNCQWAPRRACRGRHPAPFERIKRQLANEAPLIRPGGKMIAWEWYSCLSPNGGPDNVWANETRANYEQYRAYLLGAD